MALDGIFLRLLCRELDSYAQTRIEKIYQPSRDELVLLLRSAGKSAKLLISAKSGFSRIATISDTPDNPADPPTFCKLMRKYIGGAKIEGFNQQGLDRTVFINLSCYNEMGDLVHPFLAVELFSNRSNIILCEESGRIIDAIHRSDIESGTRLIQPGARYLPIEPFSKLDPFEVDADTLTSAVINSGKPAAAAFMAVIDGVSPLISRELAALATLDGDRAVAEGDFDKIKSVLIRFKKIIEGDHLPTLLSIEGKVTDFTYMAAITQYDSFASSESSDSYNELLDRFYAERDRDARLRGISEDLLKLLNNLKSRIERRLASRLSELERSRDREELRIYGELLKANLYAVERGAESVEVQNYYDPELKTVKIPLNPTISPQANAAKYFKDYKKCHTAEQTLSTLTEKDRDELVYIESVLDSLTRAESAKDIADIRDELCEAGYIRRLKAAKKTAPKIAFKEYHHGEFRIAVGKNNRENDILTLKTAAKEDIWLHTKDIPGSHVIIFTEGRTVPEETLVFAARLAAKNSKAANGENVPVDTALVKYVKKPSGAKPGMVIYTHNRTLYVTP